ncbi:hypothetical protein BJ912DRAFT_444434 [Pholiota molesta]|nr:hypothetical protein BJ912DRAFT_444434 [Pholiota molesta]
MSCHLRSHRHRVAYFSLPNFCFQVDHLNIKFLPFVLRFVPSLKLVQSVFFRIFLGPNSPVGNGPLLITIEAQADYMINRWQTENVHSFSPKAEAIEELIAFKDEFMKSTAWDRPCRSWYKTNSTSGKVTAL